MRPAALLAGSAATQELVDLCLALAEQPSLLPSLLDKANVRLDEMHRAEDGFFAGVDAQGAEFYQLLRPHIEKVEDQFRAYSEALETILEPGFDGAEAARALAAASMGLRVSMAAYEEAFLSEGPSRYPVVNLFQNVVQGVLEGRMARTLLPAVCGRYSKFYGAALEEIEQSSARQKPGVSERKQALEIIVRCIGELGELKQVDGLEAILGRMTAAHADLEEAFDTYHHHEFAEGPSEAPNINWLVQAAEAVLRGTQKPRVLQSMAQSLLDLCQQNLAEMKNLGRNKLDSEVLEEELERMTEALEDIEDALKFLVDYAGASTGTEDEVREAIEDLINSGDALVESTAIVNEAHEKAGKVTCVRCQTVQDKGGRTCVRCGAPLLQAPGDEAYAVSSFALLESDPDQGAESRDEVMTDVMHALFQACEAFMAGKLPEPALQEHLQKNLRSVEQAQSRLERMQTPMVPPDLTPSEQDAALSFIDLAEEALILLSQGVDQCFKGLSDLSRAAQADDLEALREGMRTYYEGSQKMWQVRRLERQFDEYFDRRDPGR